MLTWEDLFKFVFGACEFREKKRGTGSWVWNCNQDRTFLRQFLTKHPEVDDVSVLRILSDNHGFCDCEIVFNSAEKFAKKGRLEDPLPIKAQA